jgi:hypothetical protein
MRSKLFHTGMLQFLRLKWMENAFGSTYLIFCSSVLDIYFAQILA